MIAEMFNRVSMHQRHGHTTDPETERIGIALDERNVVMFA